MACSCKKKKEREKKQAEKVELPEKTHGDVSGGANPADALTVDDVIANLEPDKA